MEQMFVKDLLDATKGTLLCGKEDLPVERICINSKEAQVGDLFVPLIGEKVDAHRFLKMALEAGANVSLTSEHNAEGAKELLGELWGILAHWMRWSTTARRPFSRSDVIIGTAYLFHWLV